MSIVESSGLFADRKQFFIIILNAAIMHLEKTATRDAKNNDYIALSFLQNDESFLEKKRSIDYIFASKSRLEPKIATRGKHFVKTATERADAHRGGKVSLTLRAVFAFVRAHARVVPVFWERKLGEESMLGDRDRSLPHGAVTRERSIVLLAHFSRRKRREIKQVSRRRRPRHTGFCC